MSAFEFVFSLFGLLLGFSLVEVLSGLVRTVKLRSNVRIGWLTPLLGLFVLFDLTSFWNVAWQSRDTIPANLATLLLALIISSLYYFSASLVFPERPEEWPDLDEWAAKHKRQVMGGILLCNVTATVVTMARHPEALTPQVFVINAVLLGMMAIATFARPRWVTGAMLSGMLAVYLWFAWQTLGRS